MERHLDPRSMGDHIGRLHRAAWALCGSREDAEDLVQETFARVLAKPRILRREDDLAYLLRALRNVFLDQRRTESRRPRTVAMPDEALIAERRTTADPEAVHATHEVYAAIAALPGDFRDVLVAVDVAGLSYKEAAKSLKVPQGTVMSRLHRARQQVVRSLDGG